MHSKVEAQGAGYHRLIAPVDDVILSSPLNTLHGCLQLLLRPLIYLGLHSMALGIRKMANANALSLVFRLAASEWWLL